MSSRERERARHVRGEDVSATVIFHEDSRLRNRTHGRSLNGRGTEPAQRDISTQGAQVRT
ncbi:hypothetical protein ACFPRL_23365 [Pseudoclavibacter helvolus]